MKVSLKTSCIWSGVGEVSFDRFPFVVGRHREADHALPLAFVSRRHCCFTLKDEQLYVQDLESHNGTFVNGQKIEKPVLLHHGDELSLGPLSFHVVTQISGYTTSGITDSQPTRDGNEEPDLRRKKDGSSGRHQPLSV
jgi:pSer/pThr/pTyr-binding forkhead associated (FHA) protein